MKYCLLGLILVEILVDLEIGEIIVKDGDVIIKEVLKEFELVLE